MAKILIKNCQNGYVFKKDGQNHKMFVMVISLFMSQIVRKTVYFLPKKIWFCQRSSFYTETTISVV